MSISKNEIIDHLIRELKAVNKYSSPMGMTQEQYNELAEGNVGVAGESSWSPESTEIPTQSGENEWEAEIEQPEVKQEYSDEEYFKMIKNEPEHVATNLMLQRVAPYNQIKYVYPLAKSLINWITEINYSPEEGSVLYEEIKYMLDIVEQETTRKEREESE